GGVLDSHVARGREQPNVGRSPVHGDVVPAGIGDAEPGGGQGDRTRACQGCGELDRYASRLHERDVVAVRSPAICDNAGADRRDMPGLLGASPSAERGGGCFFEAVQRGYEGGGGRSYTQLV